MILRISILSRLMMSGGVPAGSERNPAQDSTSKPLSPDSSNVGRSGSSVLRHEAGDGERARSDPGLHVGKAGREVGEAHGNAATDHVVERRRHALVGHLENVDAGEALERLAGENARGVTAAIGELARVGFGVGDQLGKRLHRDRRVDHHHQREAADPGDRRKILQRVVADILEQERIGRMRRVGAGEQRVCSRPGESRLRPRRSPRCTAVRALPIVDHDALAERDAERLGDDAGDDVSAAARPERHDDGDRPGRIGLRAARSPNIALPQCRAPTAPPNRAVPAGNRDAAKRIAPSHWLPPDVGAGSLQSGRRPDLTIA